MVWKNCLWGNMKNLLTCIKSILTQTAIGLLLCSVGAYILGKAYFVMPIIAGCIVGGACWFIVVYRMTRSTELTVTEAKKNMQIGLLVRWMLMIAAFIAAIRISEEMFWAVVLGFFLISVIIMINAIVFAYNSNVNNTK